MSSRKWVEDEDLGRRYIATYKVCGNGFYGSRPFKVGVEWLMSLTLLNAERDPFRIFCLTWLVEVVYLAGTQAAIREVRSVTLDSRMLPDNRGGDFYKR